MISQLFLIVVLKRRYDLRGEDRKLLPLISQVFSGPALFSSLLPQLGGLILVWFVPFRLNDLPSGRTTHFPVLFYKRIEYIFAKARWVPNILGLFSQFINKNKMEYKYML